MSHGNLWKNLGRMFGWAASPLLASFGLASTGMEKAKPPESPDYPTEEEVAKDTAKETSAAAQAQAEALRRRRGFASTVLTGPLGLGTDSATRRATLGA